MPWPHFTSGEKDPHTPWIGGWVGPRASLDTEARRKKPFAPAGDQTPVIQPVVRLTELPWLILTRKAKDIAAVFILP
jgi:hypothetical protein